MKVLKGVRTMWAPEADGLGGGFETPTVEPPTEQIEFVITPDGLTEAERTAAAAPAAPTLDPNVAALIEGMKAQAAAVANPPKREDAGVEGVSEALKKLAALEEQRGKPVAGPVKTWEQLQDELKDLQFSDPGKAQQKLFEWYEQTRLAPVLGQLDQKIKQQEETIAELRGQTERQTLGSDPRAKFALEKYSGEVEALAKTYKGQPGAMMRAAREVSLNHDSEYLDIVIEQKLAARGAAGVPAAPALAGPGVAGVGGAAPAVRQVAMTPAMEQDRVLRGLTREDYVWAVQQGHIADLRKVR